MSSEDVKEGLQSFIDRRQAKFIGRLSIRPVRLIRMRLC